MTDFSDDFELCKKVRPRAAPIAILSLMSHESASTLAPNKQQRTIKLALNLVNMFSTSTNFCNFLNVLHLTHEKVLVQASLRHILIDKKKLILLPTET